MVQCQMVILLYMREIVSDVEVNEDDSGLDHEQAA